MAASDVDLLRRAAALMRENAALAQDTGAWDWRSEDGQTWWSERTRAGTYIQSWHPAVALAVAALIDDGASYLEHLAANHPNEPAGEYGRFFVAVARAYLNEVQP